MKRFADRLLFLLAYPFIYLLSFLPPRWAVGIGRWLGRLAFIVDARHRHIALVNLKVAFPDLRASQRWAIARKAFENIGKTFLETAGLARQGREEIQSRVRYTGPDRKEWIRAQKEGGVFLLTGHIGNWELMALAFGWEDEANLAGAGRRQALLCRTCQLGAQAEQPLLCRLQRGLDLFHPGRMGEVTSAEQSDALLQCGAVQAGEVEGPAGGSREARVEVQVCDEGHPWIIQRTIHCVNSRKGCLCVRGWPPPFPPPGPCPILTLRGIYRNYSFQ